MSQENVERACRLIEHANRTGELGPDFDSLFHPEMEFEDEIGAYHTRDEVRAFLQGFAEAIGGLHLEVEETRDLGDVIMLVVRQSGRGSASGVPIAQPFTWVMRFANDRCVRWRIYADHGRALEAAGLSEQAMSEENVEIVERAIAAVNERDIDRYLACCTEDIQLQTPVSPVAGVYEGADGIRRFFADIEDAGPDFRLDLERLEAVGGERVLAFVRVTSHGRASGLPTPAETGNVYEFKEGKISRIQIFLDRGEALEAAGLSEQAMSEENVEIRAGIRWYGRFPNLLREGIPMKRILVAVLATLALALGLSGPASAANSHASCSGLAAASRAGDPGAQAATQVQIKQDAANEEITPGAVVSGFSQFHDGSAEVCLAQFRQGIPALEAAGLSEQARTYDAAKLFHSRDLLWGQVDADGVAVSHRDSAPCKAGNGQVGKRQEPA